MSMSSDKVKASILSSNLKSSLSNILDEMEED